MTKVALDGGKIVGSGVIHHGDPGECHHKLIIRFVQVPLVSGTVPETNKIRMGCCVLLRLFELLTTIGATVVAHVVMKQAYGMSVCPVIVLFPAMFAVFIGCAAIFDTTTTARAALAKYSLEYFVSLVHYPCHGGRHTHHVRP